ncbi:uncharacterized protein ACMZJ9_014297 [Mantella aurantiaca]
MVLPMFYDEESDSVSPLDVVSTLKAYIVATKELKRSERLFVSQNGPNKGKTVIASWLVKTITAAYKLEVSGREDVFMSAGSQKLIAPIERQQIFIQVLHHRHADITFITLGHVRPHKSHSHLTTLTLLLLLASGDISPNPGPLPSNILPHTHHLSTSGCSRNTHALISIPLLPRTSPPLSCALWNARSVCNKLTSVHDLFISNSLNLLAITETWIQDSDTASSAALCHGGLHWTHSPRSSGQKGGGVGILLSPQSRFQILPSPPSLSLPSFESHCIRLFSPAPLRIAVIYRPPGPISRFLDDFSAWLPYFLSSEIPTIILGDFNIPESS